MAEPENQTLRILRDIRPAIKSMEQRLDKRFETADRKSDDLRSRIDNLRQAINGESVLGRYAAAEVEERLGTLERRLEELDTLEKRVSALEVRRRSLDCVSSSPHSRSTAAAPR